MVTAFLVLLLKYVLSRRANQNEFIIWFLARRFQSLCVDQKCFRMVKRRNHLILRGLNSSKEHNLSDCQC